jgi:hypothetical protein
VLRRRLTQQRLELFAIAGGANRLLGQRVQVASDPVGRLPGEFAQLVGTGMRKRNSDLTAETIELRGHLGWSYPSACACR